MLNKSWFSFQVSWDYHKYWGTFEFHGYGHHNEWFHWLFSDGWVPLRSQTNHHCTHIVFHRTLYSRDNVYNSCQEQNHICWLSHHGKCSHNGPIYRISTHRDRNNPVSRNVTDASPPLFVVGRCDVGKNSFFLKKNREVLWFLHEKQWKNGKQ